MRSISKNDWSNRRFIRFIEPLEQRQLLAGDVRFAVIGDFGANTPEEGNVASLIKSWNPNLILTVGDNNYQLGQASTIDANVGKYYHDFISPYRGTFGAGSADGMNHFFPTLGNREWMQPDAQPHLDYFSLPGNERYYTFTQGAVQFFAIDADPHEPDLGYVNDTTSTVNSVEAQWLKNALAASTAHWKIVYFHQPAFSSGTTHGSAVYMQWPFEQWGADAVLSGHEHNFERLNIGNIPYFVDGLGGAENVYTSFKNPPLAGSAVRYSSDFGAMLVNANDTTANFQFITRAGTQIDSYTLAPGNIAPAAPGHLSATPISSSQIQLNWRDQSSNETAFEVWRSTDNVNFIRIATTAANSTTFTDTAAVSGTRFYRIRATNSAGASAFSNTAATNAGIAAPGNLAATAISSSQIRLNWRDNSDNEARFDIYRSTDNVNFTPVAFASADSTTFTDSSLIANKTYFYRVRAVNGATSSPFSNTASATTTLTGNSLVAPSNLQAEAISSTQIGLNWTDNSAAETRFEIWRSTNNSTFAWRAQVGANVTNFTDSGVTPGVTYFYRVRASNATANSAFSNTASASTGGSTTGAPAAPSNLSAAAMNSSQIRLNWMDNSTNETGFQIFRSTDNVNFTQLTQVGSNITTFTDSNLAASTTYFYRVRALNASGTSAFSHTASSTTSGTTTNGVPAAPTNLTASAISSSQIRLNWQDNSNNEGRFEIFRSTDGVSFAFRAQVGINVTSFTDSGLTAGVTYFYRVRGVNSFGNSGWSNIASATPGGTNTGVPAAPSNLAATVASSTQINLNWRDNSTDETAFQIFRSDDGGVSFSQVGQVSANVTSFSNNALVTGKTYFFRVRAINSLGNSAFSNTVSATPSSSTTGVPVGPTNLIARGVAPGQIQLTWQDNSNNENRFEIFRSTSSAGGFAFVAQVGADVTNFTNTNLTPGATFFYRVRAVNSAGNSTWTNIASATASAPPTAAASFSTALITDPDLSLLT